jgi:Amt family ammonium transporter
MTRQRLSEILFFGLRDFDNYANWFFQFAFAATAATIVAGAVAERCKMAAYLCYSIFVTSFVYPVVVHAVWSSNGFLTAFRPDPFRGVGAIDFAGSGVVHLVGGVTSLHAIIILGPRKGRFYDEDGNLLEKPATFVPHNASLQVLGAFLLWFGWYGFNPVSALIVTTENAAITAALAAVTSTIAAASGAVSAMFTETIIEAMQTGEVSYDVSMAVNGCLSGLVAVTAGCAVVSPGSACIIGIVSGWAYIGASKLLLKLRLDDAVDAVPVHLANGLWGLIAVGLFANEQDMARAGYNSAHQGWFYEWGSGSGDANLLLCQFCEILFIIGWVTVIMLPFFYVLNVAGMFRVDPLEEEVGLDISHHRGVAYDLANAKKEDVDELMEIRASRHGKVEVPVEVAQAADNAGHDDAASP